MISPKEEAVRGSFRPSKLLLLSEFSTKEKDYYYNLLLQNNCKFHRDEETGRYVANVRMLAPHVRKVEIESRKKDTTNYSITFQERLTRLKQEGFIDVTILPKDVSSETSAEATAEQQLDAGSYPRFTSLIASDGDIVHPKHRRLSWVMKIVEDIYDFRFFHEKNDVLREDESPSFDLMLLIFPVFVVRRLGTNVGLKQLVDQTCWDLLYNTHIYRRDYLELEIFGRFLQEFYDHDDLLFFLYVRSIIAKELHINFKQRWAKSDGPGRQPKSLWMSFREASHIARIVFGADNEDLYRDFMYLITPQMVGQCTTTSDSRRIDITEYLHLSVVGYHQSQSRLQRNSALGGGSRMLIPIPGQLTPPIPAPMPAAYEGDGLDAMIGYDDDEPAAEGGIAFDNELQQTPGSFTDLQNVAASPILESEVAPEVDETAMNTMAAAPDADGGEEEPNEFEKLQAMRENEFMMQLIAPLEKNGPSGEPPLPPEFARYIAEDLRERLKQTVTIFLAQKDITDLYSLDGFLVEFLQLEQLRVDFEALRDEMVQHFRAEVQEQT